MEFQSYCLSWRLDALVKNVWHRTKRLNECFQKMVWTPGAVIMGPLSSGFSPSCCRPRPSWKHLKSKLPPIGPAATKPTWSKTVRFGQNTNRFRSKWIILFSTAAPTCNKNSHVFIHCTGNGYSLGFYVSRTTQPPPIVWVTHYNVYSFPICGGVWALRLNSIHLGIGWDAERVHRRPPSVTLYAAGLKMNGQRLTFYNRAFSINLTEL